MSGDISSRDTGIHGVLHNLQLAVACKANTNPEFGKGVNCSDRSERAWIKFFLINVEKRRKCEIGTVFKSERSSTGCIWLCSKSRPFFYEGAGA
jgi:hypothetical protein